MVGIGTGLPGATLHYESSESTYESSGTKGCSGVSAHQLQRLGMDNMGKQNSLTQFVAI